MSLESMDTLFKVPWYKIGLKGRDVAEQDVHFRHQGVVGDKDAVVAVEHVENTPTKRA